MDSQRKVFFSALLLLLCAGSAQAETVCRHVDAKGRVHFGDCREGMVTGGAVEQIDVNARRTGGVLATDAQRTAAREQAGKPAPVPLPAAAAPAAAAPAGAAVDLGELDRRCAEDQRTAVEEARVERIDTCISSGERPEAECRRYYRDYGAATRNQYSGTINRSVPLAPSCVQLNEARKQAAARR